MILMLVLLFMNPARIFLLTDSMLSMELSRMISGSGGNKALLPLASQELSSSGCFSSSFSLLGLKLSLKSPNTSDLTFLDSARLILC